MSHWQYDVKEGKEGKGWEEKWQRDPLNAAVWAGILIWAGLVLLLGNLNLLVPFQPLEAWDFIFVGGGLIVIVAALIRLLVPEYRRPVAGRVILGVILLAIGLGDLVRWAVMWPLVLIIVGVFLLVRGFLWRR